MNTAVENDEGTAEKEERARVPVPAPQNVNEAWSLDFVAAQIPLALRRSTVFDEFSCVVERLEEIFVLLSNSVRCRRVEGLGLTRSLDT